MTGRYLIGEFEIESATRRVRRRGGELVRLANRPFQLLSYLVAHRDRLVPRAELLEQFWDGRDVYEDALTRCMSTVRKALDDQGCQPRYVETRWAGGYRFIGPCSEPAAADPVAPDRVPAQPPGRSGRRNLRFSSSIAPDSVDRLLRRGHAYLGRSGNRSYRYALETFRLALAADPGCARAHGGLAASHALLYLHTEPVESHRNAAIAASRLAVEIDSGAATVQFGRALVALMREDYAEADAAFALAEALEPGVFHAWYCHGRGCAERSEHERAVTLFGTASDSNPLDYQAYALAEQSFRRLGLIREAQRAAEACADAAGRVLARCPDDARALSLASCVLPHLGRKPESRGWTERAVALEPDEPFVNFNAACVYISLGDYERALFYLGRVPMAAAGNSKWIAHDPSVDPIREHPRFQALIPPSAA